MKRRILIVTSFVLLLLAHFNAISQIRPFVTTWTTTSDPETVSIPLNGDFTYDFTFVWKNATDSSEITSGTHTSSDGAFATELPTAGNYLLEITGDFPHFQGYPKASLIDVNQWGDIIWGSFNRSFESWPGAEFSATDSPDLSAVTSMFRAFRFTPNFDADLSNWDVSNITNMEAMFQGAVVFNSNISSWNVSSATRLHTMFAEARVFDQPIGVWEVGNVTNMFRMFRSADAFNQDLDGWDVSQVSNMNEMFHDTDVFNGDVSNWNVGNVTNMFGMFDNADGFNQDLNEWNVSNVTNMQKMFLNADIFNGNISDWNVGNVTTMRDMFKNALAFNSDLRDWNVEKVTNMREMFNRAENFNADIGEWNVSQVTDMNQTFRNALNFNQDLSNWDIRKVSIMNALFDNSGLSPQNYDQILIGWATKVDETTPDVTLGASGLTFCKSEAARQSLLDNGWTINDTNNKVCLDETDILSFVLTDELFEAVINTSNHTVNAVVRFDIDISSLAPVITLSPGAIISPESETELDFSLPVAYTVTAENDTTTQIWTVNVFNQPSNDFCTGAMVVNVGDTINASSNFATSDAAIAPTCGSNQDIGAGIWFKLTGTGEAINVNTCGDGTNFDTSMSVYTGSCTEGLSCFVGNDDDCGFQSVVQFNSVQGEEYFILVEGFGSTSTGNIELAIFGSPALPTPPNDDCEDAEVLTVFQEGTGTPTNGNNTNAATFTRRNCDSFGAVNDVWFRFNSGPNVEVVVDLELVDTDGDQGELIAANSINVALYTSCDGDAVICDRTGADRSLEVTPNTDYWLQIWNDDLDDEGTFTIQLNNGPNTAADLSFRDAAAGTVEISRFAETGIEIDSVIADDDEGHTQLFSITGGNDEGIFTIDSESGGITIADTSLLSASASTSFILTIQATDQGPGVVSSTIDLTVNVIDNAPPVIATVINPIDENSPNGTEIGTIQLSDPDGDDVVPISVEVNPVGSIEVDGTTGVITVLNSELLDFEVNPTIRGSITVQDDGPLSLTTSASYTLNLNDINETPALADSTFNISSFSENGFLIGTIPFTDQDGGQTHAYTILDDGDNDGSIFTIDAATGELAVLDASILSINADTTYTFDVQVTDNGVDPLAGVGEVTINTFSNSAPVITSESFTENENAANNTLVGTLTATDVDGDNITFSLEDGSTFFTVEGNGRIRVADTEALDFETNTFFEILVGATDNGPGTLKTTKSITIFINDINESPEIESATFDISSLSVDESFVGRVEATDPEGDQLTFAIAAGDEEGVLNIDSTGVLRIANSSLLDPFGTPRYELTVEVNDGTFTASATVTVNVFVNNPPVINTRSFSIDENNEPGTIIGTIEVTDDNGIDSYQITNRNEEGLFELDESTGELRALSTFNFEDTQSYELEVTVADNGLGNLSTTKTITISINDVNEFDPLINSVTGGIVAENSSVGTAVATVRATDEDTFQSLSYEITAGNETGTFAIDANGRIATSLSIDFEETESFNLTVAVSDDLDPVRTTIEEVVITVSDVNETPTLEAIADQNGTVGSEITFTAVALDPESESLSFSFAENSAQTGMEINATTGVFTWIPASDQFGTFEVTIEVTDGEFIGSESVLFTVINNATDILTFTLAEQLSGAIVNATEHSIAIEVPFGTDISSLVPSFTLSEGATSTPASGETFDFTNPATITVTAEDGTTLQEWLVTLSFAPNNATDILSFELTQQTGEAVIDVTEHTVAVEVEFGTDLSAVVPTFTLSQGASSNPASGSTVDFTEPVSVTVTAEDGTTLQDWVVTVTENDEVLSAETDILTFVLAEQTGGAVINATDHTVAIEVAFGTDVTSLVPTFTLSDDATSNPASGATIDFTGPFTITVTAEDGVSIQDWIVTVAEGDEAPDTDTEILSFVLAEQTGAAVINPADHTVTIEVAFGTDLSALVPAFNLSEGATSNPVSGSTIDFTEPVSITVTAEDGTTVQGWIVTVTEDREETDTETNILTFILAEQTEAAFINDVDHTVSIEVAFGTDLSTLEPTFTLSEGATSDPESGSTIDFTQSETNSVTITVTAEDGVTMQNWSVTVTEDLELPETGTDILTFELVEQTGAAVINLTDHAVTIEVTFGTDVSALAPTINLSDGATSNPSSGEVINFSSPVTYTVTAEDGATVQDWTVEVTVAPGPLNVMEDFIPEVYPNPVANRLNVKTESVVSLSLRDINGRLMIPEQVGDQFQLDLSEFRNGPYLLFIKFGEQVVIRKIIKYNL